MTIIICDDCTIEVEGTTNDLTLIHLHDQHALCPTNFFNRMMNPTSDMIGNAL